VLYAPTWRENGSGDTNDTIRGYLDVCTALSSRADIMSTYQFLVKPHTRIYMKLTDAEKRSGMFVPHSIDPNELLSVVDVLISDYSSIYFDFLQTGRPILFYVPDLDEYRENRGLCFKPEELPGPFTSDIRVLGDFIQDIDKISARYNETYLSAKSWSCKHDDGQVSRRIIDVIFEGRADYNIIDDFHDGKKKVLLYVGVLRPGEGYVEGFGEGFGEGYVEDSGEGYVELSGIVDDIDYEKFDVTVFSLPGSDNGVLGNLASGIRVMQHIGEFVQADLEAECKRCFGGTSFDYAVDISRRDTPFKDVLPYAAGSVLSKEGFISMKAVSSVPSGEFIKNSG